MNPHEEAWHVLIRELDYIADEELRHTLLRILIREEVEVSADAGEIMRLAFRRLK